MQAPLGAARIRASGPPRVVIVGAGFAGLTAARALARAPVEVTLIDKRNYHLFQPLLYQVATAALSPAEIAAPIRAIVRRQKNVRVMLGKVDGIDTERQLVRSDAGDVPYDYLILATGARHAYFGRDEWEAFAPGLKKIEDATEIRTRILLAFERAELESDAARQAALLTFVIVGGGPTGVELAGAITELGRMALAADFRRIDPRRTRVVLVEAGPRLLPAFPESLSEIARRALVKLGVEVRLGKPVGVCDADGVVIDGERLAARTVVWAAGVAASPAGKWLRTNVDRAGRVKVAPDLSVSGHADVFAVGDTALVPGPDRAPVPGIAPAAKQQGKYVAGVIAARVAGRTAPAPFRYRHAGNLATIGRRAAVIDFNGFKLSGFVAWLLWGAAHIYFLIGFRNRLVVLLSWLWAYVTFKRGVRLITGREA